MPPSNHVPPLVRGLTGFLLMLLAAGPMATATEQQESPEQAAIRLLRRLREPAPPSADELLPLLTEHAVHALEPLLGVLLQERVPPLEPEDAPQQLSEPQRHLLLAALAGLEPDRLRATLEASLGEVAGEAERVLALEVLALHADARDLPRLLELGAGDAGVPRSRRLERTLCAALEDALTADPEGLRWLERHFRELPDATRADALIAVGEVGLPEGLGFVTLALGRWRDLDRLAVAQVARLAPARTRWDNDRLADLLRGDLDAVEPARCKAASLALAALQDDASIPRWIEHLEDEGTGLAANAHTALRRLTGLPFPPEPRLWREWYRVEEGRLEERPELLRRLDERDPAAVASALAQLIRQRLYRHDLAAQIAPLLRHRDAQVRRLACEVLAQLGAPGVLPELLDALEDREASVRTAAVAALERLTGERGPPQRDAWSEAVERHTRLR